MSPLLKWWKIYQINPVHLSSCGQQHEIKALIALSGRLSLSVSLENGSEWGL